MKIYVGITDYDWFKFISMKNCKEVNFWKPGTTPFKVLQENELFLFKLHSPHDYIVGGGFFVKYSQLPTYLAWDAFGEENGVSSLAKLNEKIAGYRQNHGMTMANPQIGCVILTDVFTFAQKDWIPVPASFKKGIVQGKGYEMESEDGRYLYAKVQEKLPLSREFTVFEEPPVYLGGHPGYTESLTKHRLGQGGFRIAITDAYQRRCAITGEKTLPVLQAAHIKPYSEDGPHSVDNGMLLKSDFHTLFDKGYITVDTDLRVHVSGRIKEEFHNGHDYYAYDDKKLLVVPENDALRPAKEFLEWHNKNVFKER